MAHGVDVNHLPFSVFYVLTMPLMLSAENWCRLRSLHLQACNYIDAYTLFFIEK